jgi:repressor LexA
MVRDTSELSPRQRRILEMIRAYSAQNGYPPSIREIGEATGISSTSVVSYNLAILQRKGYLTREREVSRGLRLVGDEVNVVSVPLLGAIAAGAPIPVPDGDLQAADELEQVSLPSDMTRNWQGVYALRVRGQSMIDALINDGDIVILRQQDYADNGDMVAVWLKEEQEATLKRFVRVSDDLVRLKPENAAMQPIEVHPANIEIKGKVVGVLRRLG